jgi:hypothetical protein
VAESNDEEILGHQIKIEVESDIYGPPVHRGIQGPIAGYL